MKYNDLNINEKINVKSWVEHETNKILDRYYKGRAKVKVLPYVLILGNVHDSGVLGYRFYQCDRETRLFRNNWKHLPPQKSLFWNNDNACSAWYDKMILGKIFL